jgi:hypothetical protein
MVDPNVLQPSRTSIGGDPAAYTWTALRAFVADLDRPASPHARRRYLDLAFAGSVFAAILAILYVTLAPDPYHRFPFLLGTDFANTWVGARGALTGDPTPWFDPARLNAELKLLFGRGYPEHIWSYPPHLLLLVWPLGFLPVWPAYLVWCAVSGALYVAVVAQNERRVLHLVLMTIAPAVSVNLYVGQNGFLTAALLIGGLLALDRRPLLAGVLFGLLTIKPQLGILLPVMLILTGRWRTIVAAAITAVALVGGTALVFGPKVWTDYFAVAGPPQTRIITEGYDFFMAMMPTPFMNLRAAGVSAASAAVVQGVFSAAAVGALIWVFWRRRDPALSNALFVTLTFLATPYAFNYDMIVFGWVIGLVLKRADTTPLDLALMFLIWMTPALVYFLGLWGQPWSSAVFVLFAGRLLWKLTRAEDRHAAVPTAAVSCA